MIVFTTPTCDMVAPSMVQGSARNCVGLSDLEEGVRGFDSSDKNKDYKNYPFNPDDIDLLIKAIRTT